MTDGCINPDNFQRMNMKPAMIIFSTTMAIAIRTYLEFEAVSEQEKQIKLLFEGTTDFYVYQTILLDFFILFRHRTD